MSVPGSEQEMNRRSRSRPRRRLPGIRRTAVPRCADRNESCGAHFREEYQYPDGEAKRDDEEYCYVAAWEYKGVGQAPVLHKEPLVFEAVKP